MHPLGDVLTVAIEHDPVSQQMHRQMKWRERPEAKRQPAHRENPAGFAEARGLTNGGQCPDIGIGAAGDRRNDGGIGVFPMPHQLQPGRAES